MPRPLRIVYEGAFYHITARGNERKNIFLSRRDYEKFLSYLTDAVHKFRMVVHAFVLMKNHYHLIGLAHFLLLLGADPNQRSEP
jgi:putative transposase